MSAAEAPRPPCNHCGQMTDGWLFGRGPFICGDCVVACVGMMASPAIGRGDEAAAALMATPVRASAAEAQIVRVVAQAVTRNIPDLAEAIRANLASPRGL